MGIEGFASTYASQFMDQSTIAFQIHVGHLHAIDRGHLTRSQDTVKDEGQTNSTAIRTSQKDTTSIKFPEALL